VLCIIAVALPPGEKPFEVKINNNNSIRTMSARVQVKSKFLFVSLKGLAAKRN
jgi:hypothetical protein